MIQSNTEIGCRIKTLIDNSGYSQKELSKLLGSSESTISKWTKGNSITLEAVGLLSDHLHCSIDYILTGKEFGGKDKHSLPHIDKSINTYFEGMEDAESNGIPWSDAMTFFIASNMFDVNGKKLDYIDYRFADAWATYLAIDTLGITYKNKTHNATLQIDSRKILHEIDITSLETFVLCRIVDLLKEKKQQYMKKFPFQQLHQENLVREEQINTEEAEYFENKYVKHRKASTTHKLPYKNGGKL